MTQAPPLPKPCDGLFLDAGNTVLLMDFQWLKGLMSQFGWNYSVPTLMRAEAWARPRLSRFLQEGTSTEAPNTLLFYASKLLEKAAKIEEKSQELASQEEKSSRMKGFLDALRGADNWNRLWSRVPEGLPQAFEAFKKTGRSLGIISNADGTVAEKLEKAGLFPFFDFVIDSGLVGVEKPDPAIFQLGLDRAELPPERVLYVGDLFAIDVIGARAAKITGALVDPFGDWKEANCPKRPSVTGFVKELIMGDPFGEPRTR
jgi:putative hydrolase of the HAD superfamily